MIIFLDFDGVLHGYGDSLFASLPRFESVMRKHLFVYVVLSTSWRTVYPLSGLLNLFSADLRERILGVTPVIDEGSTLFPYRRYQEVLLYLRNKGLKWMPWIAIEDDRGCYPLGLSNILWCDPDYGLTEKSVITLQEMISFANLTHSCEKGSLF